MVQLREKASRVFVPAGAWRCISIDDKACTQSALGQALECADQHAALSQSRQFAALITGIPTGGKQQSQLGDTFLLLRLPQCVVVVDSHKHLGQKQGGTVIAESQTMQEMLTWIFRFS